MLKCNGDHEHYSETTPCCPDICTPIVRVCDCLINTPSCQCERGYNRDPKTGVCFPCTKIG